MAYENAPGSAYTEVNGDDLAQRRYRHLARVVTKSNLR